MRRSRLAAAVTAAAALAVLPAAAHAGTRQIADVNPGYGSSFPSGFAAAGDDIFFVATDGVRGRELFRTDGTASGTRLVADIRPGSESSGIADVTAVNDTLYFVADDGVRGSGLWRSDGTAAGTALVRDLHPGDDRIDGLAAFRGGVVFTAFDPVTDQHQVMRSDGTAAGTTVIETPDAGFGNAPQLAVLGDTLLFTVFRRATRDWALYKTDGSPGGATLVEPLESLPGETEVVGSTLYFVSAGKAGPEVWKTDGTAAGTGIVKNIYYNPGSEDPQPAPHDLTAFDGRLYFTAAQVGTGLELWRSDGTAAGTVRVKDIYPGAVGSDPTGLVVVGGRLLFQADDGTTGYQLWRSDGTPAGTTRVTDFLTPAGYPRGIQAVVGDLLYFTEDADLLRTDGTASGTRLVDTFESLPAGLTGIGDRLYFSADRAGQGVEPLRTAPRGIAADPDPADFGAQRATTIGDGRAIRLSQAGEIPLRIGGVRVTGPDADEFLLPVDGCSGTEVAVGAGCDVVVRFAPGAEGPRSAILRVTSDADDGALEIPLAGTGLPEPGEAPPAALGAEADGPWWEPEDWAEEDTFGDEEAGRASRPVAQRPLACRVAGARTVRCALAERPSGRSQATLSRGGRRYARVTVDRRRPVVLRADRRLQPGRYTVALSRTSGGARRTVLRATVAVR